MYISQFIFFLSFELGIASPRVYAFELFGAALSMLKGLSVNPEQTQ